MWRNITKRKTVQNKFNSNKGSGPQDDLELLQQAQVKYEQQLEGKRDEFRGRNQDKDQEGEQQRPNPHLTTKATSGVLYRKKEGEAMNADSLLLTDRVFK